MLLPGLQWRPGLIALVAGAGFVPLVSNAADAKPENPSMLSRLYLDEVVVTGTRTPRTVSDTPVRTEVVTQEEIENTHARDLKDALENVQGLQLRQIHGKSGYEVWMQGVNADRVLILIDGLPVTATTGSSVDVTQIATLDIERIEIVKGAVSAQYGSSAMGGVVNVITRPIPEGAHGKLTIDGGSYGDQNPSGERYDFSRRNAQAGLSLGNEQLRWRIAASRRETDGIDPEPDTWARPGDAVEHTDVSNRLEWLPSDAHRLYAQVGLFREDIVSHYLLDRPGAPVNAGKDETVDRWRASIGGRHQPADGPEWHWDLMHENLDDVTDKYTAGSRFDYRDANVTLSQASGWTGLDLTETHYLQVGADYRRNGLEQTLDGASELDGPGKFSQNSKEIWLQDTWMPSDRWEIVPGVRYQHDSDFGDHVAPKINARYGLYSSPDIDIYLRGGWGSGYRVPNLKERHYLFDHSQLGYIVNGTPDLQPEESDSYQFGGGLRYRNIAWVEVNGFYNDFDQLIQTELNAAATAARNDGIQVYQYANVEKARTQGAELTVGWQFREGWKVTAGYTYLEAEDLTNNQPLTRRPRHDVRAGFDGLTPLPGLSWLLRIRSQSDETVDAATNAVSPGFTTYDFKLNQDITDSIRLFGGVNNVTDEQRNFDNASDFGPVSGRYIYAGIEVGFGTNTRD